MPHLQQYGRPLFIGIFASVAAAVAVMLTAVLPAAAEPIQICSGFGCYYKKPIVLGSGQRKRFGVILASGRESPGAERRAVSDAVRYFENHVAATFGVRDDPKGEFGGGRIFGQMDCIDESRNTRSLLLYLDKNGYLKHHTVARNASRGMFLDRRYPHNTAVLRETKSGTLWVIDSWYEPAGGPPDIMLLDEWKKRGVWGVR